MRPVATCEIDQATYRALREALKHLPEKIAKKALRTGLTKAGRYMARQVKAEAGKYRDTGTLQMSIASKVLTDKAGFLGAIIGPSRLSKTRTTKGGRRLRATRAEVKAKQSNVLRYAHLLEFGHRMVGPKPNLKDTGKRITGRRFMTHAFERAKAEAMDIVASEIRNFISNHKGT